MRAYSDKSSDFGLEGANPMSRSMPAWYRFGLASVVVMTALAGVKADVMPTPIHHVQGTFVGGYHVPTSSSITFENGVVIQLDSPIHGTRVQSFTVDVANMMTNPGAVGFHDPTASHPLNVVLHGNDGQRAEFAFLSRPHLNAGSEWNHFLGQIRLVSSTFTGADFSPFENGGTFELFFSAHDITVTPGDLHHPGGIALIGAPVGIPEIGGSSIGSGYWFVFRANPSGDGDSGTETPEPASLALFGALLPAGYWLVRRRRS